MNKESENKVVLDDDQKKLLCSFVQGAVLTFQNADQLFHEADVLARNGAIARSYLLHQISMEECGKIEFILVYATHLLTTGEFNEKKFKKITTLHANKNKTNAYYLEVSDDERKAREKGELKEAAKIFDEKKENFHQESNRAKNAALYVDYNDGVFSSPVQCITPEMLAEIRQNNSKFMQMSEEKVLLLRRIRDDIEFYQYVFVNIENKFQEHMDTNPENPFDAMEVVLEEVAKIVKAS
ncbi:AbiV family abortive infection protein [Halodesulfovibrio aestuarii]|uniref:Abortive infection protein, AbiV family n=1 Tax=Halodesulfovibrio aestuarii TaxID=126333 RepID=A0A8G2C8U7_9BACT|nr:AbiV family abortive infection protein [Halodesulfovibrio aestuarii]SHI98733.1 abortive infection protein, AbiV family [Halodesulfovibrio aestuarii]